MSTPHDKAEEAKRNSPSAEAPSRWKRSGKRRRKIDVGEKDLHLREVAVVIVSNKGTRSKFSCRVGRVVVKDPRWAVGENLGSYVDGHTRIGL